MINRPEYRTKFKPGSLAFVLVLFLLQVILVSFPVLADPDFVQAAPGQDIGIELILDASETALQITAPEPVSDWTLQPQESPNTKQGTLVIKATGFWTVSVTSDHATAGYMSEYDPASSKFVQGGRRLSEPLVIVAQDGNAVDLSKGGALIQGQGDMVVPITFEQAVSWIDPPLPDGHSYQIGLMFTGLAG